MPKPHLLLIALTLALLPALQSSAQLAAPKKGESIVLIGNGLPERAQYYGSLEMQFHLLFPNQNLTLRNLGNPGDTPAYRPRPSRTSQWAFEGADAFQPNYRTHYGIGHYPTPDEWLTTLQADTIFAFFGFNESFDGPAALPLYKKELAAFIQHTLKQKYNGHSAPQLVIVSPIAFQNLSATQDLPDGAAENKNLKLYTDAMAQVAQANNVPFIDLFAPTQKWFASDTTAPGKSLTINGAHLSKAGYEKLAPLFLQSAYGNSAVDTQIDAPLLLKAVNAKNWFWLNDYRMVNGVHVHGRRYTPYGNVNYPEELEKMRQMVTLRDQRIFDVAQGNATDTTVDDSVTRPLTEIKTNYTLPIEFLGREKAIQNFNLPEGYQANLFASETEFPDLKNPVQMTFDNKGRLWVSVMPSYPHYRPGDALPNDKILIFEDTDNDGVADRQIVFAENLHLPIGFTIAAEGVYVTQQPNLTLLRDLDGDDHADTTEIIMGGFDSHDTHHAISAFAADPSGAFFMHEGRFLHSQVETPYGPERCNDGGVWRFDPKNWRLERHVQSDFSNPWGQAIDQWGQNFTCDASPGQNWWSLPLSIKMPFGEEVPQHGEFTTHKVRPTSGAEFIYSAHFPDDVQGDFLICNSIGFLGAKQHSVVDDGSGFTGKLRHNLFQSSDPNFRPVDLEFAKDGSLYVVDWHNPLIGHMQHSARDPNRDQDHGRIYRITYTERPLLTPAKIDGAPIASLLESLKDNAYRTRVRARRELREHPADQVVPAVKAWARKLDKSDPNYDRNLLEALWATWGQNAIDPELLNQVLNVKTPEARAAGVRVVRYGYHLPNRAQLLMKAANDSNPRVRLEAVVAATWLENEAGARIVLEALKHPYDDWMAIPYETALKNYKPIIDQINHADLASNANALKYLAGDFKFIRKNAPVVVKPDDMLKAKGFGKVEFGLFNQGAVVYDRDAHCVTCHQPNGEGLPNLYPSIAKSEWLQGDKERLIKITLKGLWGDITVKGQTFKAATTPPMTGFGGLLSDTEIAAVLTYARNSFGNDATPVYPDEVAKVRAQVKDRQVFYMIDDMLKLHPFQEGELEANLNKKPGKKK